MAHQHQLQLQLHQQQQLATCFPTTIQPFAIAARSWRGSFAVSSERNEAANILISTFMHTHSLSCSTPVQFLRAASYGRASFVSCGAVEKWPPFQQCPHAPLRALPQHMPSSDDSCISLPLSLSLCACRSLPPIPLPVGARQTSTISATSPCIFLLSSAKSAEKQIRAPEEVKRLAVESRQPARFNCTKEDERQEWAGPESGAHSLSCPTSAASCQCLAVSSAIQWY